MDNKQFKKKRRKYWGKNNKTTPVLFAEHVSSDSAEMEDSLERESRPFAAKLESCVQEKDFFWKGRLPKIDEKDKIVIDCPRYSDIPVYESEEKKTEEGGEGKTEIVGVRFRAAGKVYYFLPYIPDDHGRINSKIIHTKSGDSVIVDTARGIEIGTVFVPNKFIENEKIEALKPMRSILRIATEEDLKISRENTETEKNAEKIFVERVNAHGLPMKLIDIQYTFDRTKLLFYFSSEGRVDFRELVKDLASIFHTRIELRQIGIRDEARLMGGLGACGRPLCCSSFLSDFVQVSIKMAKSQVMSLNPTKISGCCGRLMCCLRYENDTYEQEIAKTPPVDSVVKTENGFGTVIEINPLAELVKVRLVEKSDTPVAYYHRDSVELISERDEEYLAAVERARAASSVQSNTRPQPERSYRQQPQTRNGGISVKVAATEEMFSDNDDVKDGHKENKARSGGENSKNHFDDEASRQKSKSNNNRQTHKGQSNNGERQNAKGDRKDGTHSASTEHRSAESGNQHKPSNKNHKHKSSNKNRHPGGNNHAQNDAQRHQKTHSGDADVSKDNQNREKNGNQQKNQAKPRNSNYRHGHSGKKHHDGKNNARHTENGGEKK